jgi:rhodanese-related sulfurtransferase
VWPFRPGADKGKRAAVDSDEADLLFREGAALVDVREVGEWKQGHVPGSVNIPLSQLSRRLPELDPNTTTLVICHSGSRSMAAVRTLTAQGFKEVYNVSGGASRWRRRGLPFSV